MRLISILIFLREFHDVPYRIGIHRGIKTWLISYFKGMPTVTSSEALFLRRKISASRLHGERLSKYVKAVIYLIIMDASDLIIAWKVKRLDSYKWASEVTASSKAKILYNKSLRWRKSPWVKGAKPLLVEDLNQSVCNNMIVRLKQFSGVPLEKLARYGNTFMNNADRGIMTCNFVKERADEVAVKTQQVASICYED